MNQEAKVNAIRDATGLVNVRGDSQEPALAPNDADGSPSSENSTSNQIGFDSTTSSFLENVNSFTPETFLTLTI